MTGARSIELAQDVGSPPPPDRDALRAALSETVGRDVADRDLLAVRAPGRVNLIGEHTDYNEGLVLPAAIDLEIRIGLVASDDRRAELTSLDTGETLGFDLDDVGPRRGAWIDYVAGTAWSLAEAGVGLRGIRGVVASTLPPSSGLSSSAALELGAAWSLAPEAADIEPVRLAQLCQRAENEYVGVRTGLMDQFASANGRRGAAVLLDCRSLEWRPVPLPLDRATLVVAHTGSTRKLDGSAYNARRAQCEHAVAVVRERHPDVRALRDVTLPMLEEAAAELDDETIRRCEHVIAENERVLQTVDALGRGDLATVGALFAASHHSLRDLYEVSSPQLDALVEIASGVPGVFGARMTGAGFGGCIVALVDPRAVDDLARTIFTDYPPRTLLEPRAWAVTPTGGAGLID